LNVEILRSDISRPIVAISSAVPHLSITILYKPQYLIPFTFFNPLLFFIFFSTPLSPIFRYLEHNQPLLILN
jgi:hypothetical protein